MLPICSEQHAFSALGTMISLVDQMLSLNKQLPVTKTDHEKTALQRQIDATDKQVDRLVYELYGLTEEEIRIVDGRSR